MANPNTAINVGIRHDFATLGARNYEPKGGAAYLSNRDNLEYKGSLYDVGDAIPFDGTLCYTDDALMEMYFNSGWLTPTT
jgi:hypothetical protein